MVIDVGIRVRGSSVGLRARVGFDILGFVA